MQQHQYWYHRYSNILFIINLSSLNPTFFNCRGPSVVSRGAVNQSNGKSGHGSASQSLVGSVRTVPKSSSAANGTVNQENLRPQAAAVAASPDQTFVSVSSIDQEKSLSSTDQSQTSVSGVYSPSSDPVLEPSISRNHGVNGAISREVGSNRISAGPNHVMGNKLQEDGDLSASNNENSGSMNSTSNLNATQKSNEVINNQLPEPSQLSSPPSLNGSLRSSSSCSTELPPGKSLILCLFTHLSNRIFLCSLFLLCTFWYWL